MQILRGDLRETTLFQYCGGQSWENDLLDATTPMCEAMQQRKISRALCKFSHRLATIDARKQKKTHLDQNQFWAGFCKDQGSVCGVGEPWHCRAQAMLCIRSAAN